MICHQCLRYFAIKLDCQLVQVFMFVVVPRDQGDCLSSSLFLNMILICCTIVDNVLV